MPGNARFGLWFLTMCGVGFGCGASKPDYKDLKEVQADAKKEHDHATHDGAHLHYGAGPHGGTVLELGGDDFHAELVFDHDSHAIRVFLLGGDVKTPLPSKAGHVTLLLDQGKSVKLQAVPLDSDSDGQSSRFELVDEAAVHEILKKGFLHGDLEVEINSKPFKSHLDIHFDNEKHTHKDEPTGSKDPEGSKGSLEKK